MKGQWTKVYSGDLPLRSWWVDSGSDCKYISIVLPEVFGINHWIRSFSEKLAKQNVTVLALPLYGRTAPKLDLSYSEADLKLSPSMFSEEVKISCTSTGDSAAIEMLGLISINAKANEMNKFLIMKLNFYKII